MIYKELIKKYINTITANDIKQFAKYKKEFITDKEAIIILNHIKQYQEELLNKKTSSFKILKQNIRKDLFNKIEQLYNEYQHYI
ncbi:MAG: DUF2624 family protein [Bacilli bacterium]|nr:DUF2624 family protein [Bacilli bacterium]